MIDAASAPSPLRLFRSGTDTPPVFITHGLGGSVTELSKLIGQLQTNRPIYGIQWKGLDGWEPPCNRVEDMAEYFIEAMIRVQPNGPYLLSGLSSGGLIMLEVAIKLTRRGERIALLAFLDTYPLPRYWPLTIWIESLSHRVKTHSMELIKMGASEAIPRFVTLCRNVAYHIRMRRGESADPALYVEDGDPPALQRLRKSAIEAFSQYQLQYYTGKITFLKAEVAGRFPSNVTKIWKKFAPQLEIHAFACNHVAMITTHAGPVAAQLSLCIERALPLKDVA